MSTWRIGSDKVLKSYDIGCFVFACHSLSQLLNIVLIFSSVPNRGIDTMNPCWIFCKLLVWNVDFIYPASSQWQSDSKIDDLFKPNVNNKFGKHNNVRGRLDNFQQTTFYQTISYYIHCGCVIIWCMPNYLWVEPLFMDKWT